MECQIGRILKSKDVKMEGCFHLDIDQNMPNSANKKNITLAPARVNVVENHPEFAIMEVVCGCGEKIHIRCEYTNTQSTEQGTDQKNNGENDNAS